MDRFEITAANNKMLSLFHFDKKDGPPKKLTAAVYTCTASGCGETLLGNNSVGFSCPCCKADMKAGATKDLVASDLAKLTPVGECGFCQTKLISASEATGEFKDGKLYCPVCSDVVTVKADESDENPEQEDMAPDADSTEDEDGEMDPADLPEGDDETDGDEDGTENEDENADDADTETAGDAETDDSDSAGEDGSDSDGGSEDDSDAEKAETVDVGSDKDDDMDDLEASLLAAVGDKEVDVNLVASPNRKKWYLFADDVPVAVSEKSRVAEGIREHFENDKFAAAYHATSKDGATNDLLQEFGFEPIVTKVPADEAIRQTVEAQVNERARSFALNASDYNERLTKCLGLAAMGMVKGTFNDKNPVQEALVPVLHRLNVGDAQNIVASAFEKQSPALFKTLILRATDLMEKDDATVVEISKIVEDQPIPSERAVKKGIPPAAMTVIEEERIETVSPKREPELTASENDSAGFDDLFQRRKTRRHA